MYTWRVWLAFETRPGVTVASTRNTSGQWEHLARACHRADGTLDFDEFNRWVDVLIEHAHLWCSA